MKSKTMAKGFPYFKFIATEWLTGDIVFEDFELQGIFINVCALYWHRDGKVTLDEVKKRFKSDRLPELNDRFISVSDGFISIKFLDEQLIDANHISKVNSENGKKGGRKPTANRPLTDRKAKTSKEEEKESKEEVNNTVNIWTNDFTFLKNDELWWEQNILKDFKLTTQEIDNRLEQYWLSLQKSNFKGELNQIRAGFKKWLKTWNDNSKEKTKPEKIPESVRLGKAKMVEVNGQMLVKPLNWQP